MMPTLTIYLPPDGRAVQFGPRMTVQDIKTLELAMQKGQTKGELQFYHFEPSTRIKSYGRGLLRHRATDGYTEAWFEILGVFTCEADE
jgi:hypothetical protein